MTITDTEVIYGLGGKLNIGSIGGSSGLDVEVVTAIGKTSATPAVTSVQDKTVYNKMVSGAGNETFVGTAQSDHFVFDQSKKIGADTIIGFGKSDVLVTHEALTDGNGDGLITFGADGVLHLGSEAGTITMAGSPTVLRALGHTDEGFIYGDASARPNSALEGKMGAGDILTSDKGDKLATKFFIDNALGLNLGEDELVLFGAKDILVTTAKLGDEVVGSTLASGGSSFDLLRGGHDLGQLSISDVAGKDVTSLEFSGEYVAGGVHYFVYRLEGSAAGVANLGF